MSCRIEIYAMLRLIVYVLRSFPQMSTIFLLLYSRDSYTFVDFLPLFVFIFSGADDRDGKKIETFLIVIESI